MERSTRNNSKKTKVLIQHIQHSNSTIYLLTLNIFDFGSGRDSFRKPGFSETLHMKHIPFNDS